MKVVKIIIILSKALTYTMNTFFDIVWQSFLFRLQNDGWINYNWCILIGNHFHLLGKGVCNLKNLIVWNRRVHDSTIDIINFTF
jgi:hypothetical protein